MFKKLIICSLIFCNIQLAAQTTETNEEVSFELGSGLNFRFNDGAYEFKLGGMIQPSFAYEKTEELDADYFFNAKRTYFNFSGKAIEQKVSFLLQTDFSLGQPLLDAWIGFHPNSRFNIYFGQKQSIGNNREMMIMETFLTFPERSLLSTELSQTGREFGLFLDYEIGTNNFAIIPQMAVTSGDGRNSFGSDSRDVDYGGFKYAGRLDIYPLGKFTKGNHNLIADLAHEASPKLLIGVAGSFNDGASQQVGAGHGEFLLYNKLGKNQLPDYRQVYSDILIKYKGFSILGEYSIASATNLEGSYVDQAGTDELQKTEISEYLSLGTALNLQLGYVTKSGYGADFRYASTSPEFANNKDSKLKDLSAITVGFSRYLKNNDLKLQTAVTSLTNSENAKEVNTIRGELILQLIF